MNELYGYWGLMNAQGEITWTGPLTRAEMKDKCDIFRHNGPRLAKPETSLISVERAMEITEAYYGCEEEIEG